MRNDFKERYRLIVERLKMAPCTFEQMKTYLLKSNEFQRCEISEYSIRTFQRDVKEVEIEYDIEIKNNMGAYNQYFIIN